MSGNRTDTSSRPDKGQTDRNCANCTRDLNIGIAPKRESCVIHCRRCGLDNVVQYGIPTRGATRDEIAEAQAERATLRVAV